MKYLCMLLPMYWANLIARNIMNVLTLINSWEVTVVP